MICSLQSVKVKERIRRQVTLALVIDIQAERLAVLGLQLVARLNDTEMILDQLVESDVVPSKVPPRSLPLWPLARSFFFPFRLRVGPLLWKDKN